MKNEYNKTLDQLMEKISSAIDQKTYCSNEMSASAIEHIKSNYGKDKMCKKTLEFYKIIEN